MSNGDWRIGSWKQGLRLRVRRKKLESKGWRWEREWANKNERLGIVLEVGGWVATDKWEANERQMKGVEGVEQGGRVLLLHGLFHALSH